VAWVGGRVQFETSHACIQPPNPPWPARTPPPPLPAQTPQTLGGSEFVPGELDGVGEAEEGGDFDPGELLAEERGAAAAAGGVVVEESAGEGRGGRLGSLAWYAVPEHAVRDMPWLGKAEELRRGALRCWRSSADVPCACAGPKRAAPPPPSIKPGAAKGAGSAGRAPAPQPAKRGGRGMSVKDRLKKKLRI
jgi:hypothetical protein